MPARTPARILEDVTQGRGKSSQIRRKLSTNKENNWLLAIVLNAFTRLADDAKLTDLDKIVVDAFKKNGFKTSELKRQGETAKAMSDQLRQDIFPIDFVNMKAFSMKDLQTEAPKIVRRVIARPNVATMDIAEIHAGRKTIRDFGPVPRAVAREFASQVLIAVEPTATAPSATPPKYTIKATEFHCTDRQTDSVFGPSDEIYWIFGSLGNATAVTTRTGVFGDVDNGETRSFTAGDGCIWGQNCGAQAFPDGEIGTLIQLWEHDEGNMDNVRAGVAAAFAAAAGILAATGVAAWIAAVVAGVGAVLHWLLGFLDDDHIADQTIVFSRAVVDAQIDKGVGVITRRFSDGDGDFTLTMRLRRFS